MLIQQFQRPARLLVVAAAMCLIYLCLTYVERADFNYCAGTLHQTVFSPFGATRQLSAPPTTVPSRSPARIAKVGVAVNALDIPAVYRAFASHKVHNDIHGYPHFISDKEVVGSLTDNDRFKRGSGAYTKPAYIMAIIIAELLKPVEERLEWLFWFDGDIVVMNPSTALETFLPPNTTETLRDINLIIASNWDGLNSGAFAIRVHKWSASFLSAVLAYPLYEHERTTKDRFRDQSAIQFVLTSPHSPLARDRLAHRNYWAEVPMRWFNSLPVNNAFRKDGSWLFGEKMTNETFDNGTTDFYQDGHDRKIKPWKVMQGDMMVHFAGTKNVRDSWMMPWLDRTEKMLPQWNNATRSQELVQEVAAWWVDYDKRAKESFRVEEERWRKQEEEKKKQEEEKKKQEEEKKKQEEEKKKQEEEKKKQDEERKKQEEEEKKRQEEEKQKQKQEEARKQEEAPAQAPAQASSQPPEEARAPPPPAS